MYLVTIIKRLHTVFSNYDEHKKWCEWNEANGRPCECKGFFYSVFGNALRLTDLCCECPWDEFIY